MKSPAIAILLGVLGPSLALAQGSPAAPPAPSPGAAAPSPSPESAPAATGPRPKGPRIKYDPATVVTVTGTVLGDVDHVRRGGTRSVRLVVKVGDDQVSVHLGPESFVESRPVQFARGDEVTVRGSKFTWSGHYGLIAQTVTRGGDTVVFRDPSGKPAWPPPEGRTAATAGPPPPVRPP